LVWKILNGFNPSPGSNTAELKQLPTINSMPPLPDQTVISPNSPAGPSDCEYRSTAPNLPIRNSLP